MRLPLVYNPRSGHRRMAPDALLARLPREVRDRLQPVALELPFDYAPGIRQAADSPRAKGMAPSSPNRHCQKETVIRP